MSEASYPGNIEHLVSEFVDAIRRGDKLSVNEFAAKHPEDSEAITQLFPAIQSMEELRCARLSPPGPAMGCQWFEGKRLGDFRVVEEIGRGGMGVVFLAKQISLGRTIALKVLPPSFGSDNRYLKRFQREARIAAKLHHTNIVPVFGVGQEGDVLYIVMQHICGVGLDKIIDGGRKERESTDVSEFSIETSLGGLLSSRQTQDRDESVSQWCCFDQDLSKSIAKIGLQASSALQYAHEQGVLHRDVTPSNLLLDKNGRIWVADFGLARAIESEGITETGGLMGTLKYMAPEQYCQECDARSDVYSLGLTLFELATLTPARDTKEFFRSVAENRTPQPAPKLRKLNPKIDRNLEAIIMRAIDPDRDQRYQSAGELADDFELFLNGELLRTQRPTVVKRMVRWWQRNPTAAAATSLAAVLMVLVTILSTLGYLREVNYRAQNGKIAGIATDALDEIYEQLAPRNLPQDVPAIRSGGSPVSSFDVVRMPSNEMFAVLEKLQNHYERVSEFSLDASIKLKAADAKNRIGQINIYLGKLAAAEHAFVGASDMCLEILDDDSVATQVGDDARILLAATWNQLGYVYRGQFNDLLAEKAHDQAARYLKGSSKTLQRQTAFQFELARTLYSQDINVARNHSGEDALARTELALEILAQIKTDFAEESEVQLLKARCFRRLSEQLGVLPNPSDQESIQIMRELVLRFPDIPQYQFELGYSLAGSHFDRLEDNNEFQERIGEALAIAGELMENEPNVPRYMQLAVLANEQHAKYRRAMGDSTSATTYTDAAIQLQKSLVKRFPGLVAQHRVFLYALKLEGTNLMIEQMKYEEARLELVDITTFLETLIEKPELEKDWHTLRVLTSSFDSLARISKRLEEFDLAETARVKADNYRERLFKISL